jgi:hypothetical protein
MGIYARRPGRFLGQLTADLFVLLWGIAWGMTGSFVHDSINTVAEPARKAAGSADQISAQLRDAGAAAGQLPAIGEELRRPFDTAADSVGQLRESAARQVASIEHVADIAGWLVFLIPVVILLALWLPLRIRFFLRARAAQQFIDSSADLDLFALRAMASQPMHVLARISDDPVEAWRAGDRQVIRSLAEVELRRNGLRLPSSAAGPPAY